MVTTVTDPPNIPVQQVDWLARRNMYIDHFVSSYQKGEPKYVILSNKRIPKPGYALPAVFIEQYDRLCAIIFNTLEEALDYVQMCMAPESYISGHAPIGILPAKPDDLVNLLSALRAQGVGAVAIGVEDSHIYYVRSQMLIDKIPHKPLTYPRKARPNLCPIYDWDF